MRGGRAAALIRHAEGSEPERLGPLPCLGPQGAARFNLIGNIQPVREDSTRSEGVESSRSGVTLHRRQACTRVSSLRLHTSASNRARPCSAAPDPSQYTRSVALHPIRRAAPDQKGCNAYGSGAPLHRQQACTRSSSLTLHMSASNRPRSSSNALDTAAMWPGLVLWTGCFEGCWLLLVVLCPLACVLVG